MMNDTMAGPSALSPWNQKCNGELSASIESWYKYAKLLGISKKPPRCLKKRKIGIRASTPNEIWHADVSVFRTADHVKAYLYFIVDNFSRSILSWRVSLKLCAPTRLETIKEAYFKYIHNTGKDVSLMVDGGSENNNSEVDGFINSVVSIKKIIAQQDIHFSNSMVEAVNKIVKYRSLFLKDITNFEALQKHLKSFVPVYNQVRPHISLKGLTPAEVLSGMRPDNIEDLKKAGLISSKQSFQRADHINCTACLEKKDISHVKV